MLHARPGRGRATRYPLSSALQMFVGRGSNLGGIVGAAIRWHAWSSALGGCPDCVLNKATISWSDGLSARDDGSSVAAPQSAGCRCDRRKPCRARRIARPTVWPAPSALSGIGRFAANAAISHQSYGGERPRIPAINQRF
jgi:hypothetical protein